MLDRLLKQRSLEIARCSARLSTGYHINRAADDAAGLAISNKVRAQIRGTDQASRNAQDAISLIETAEGSLSGIDEIIQRVRELVVQAANDVNGYVAGGMSESDRTKIQYEINQLLEEIDQISENTQFNKKTLLDGRYAQAGSIAGSASSAIRQTAAYMAEPAAVPMSA